MNKKFSTLLAAALVAGGLGSSAFATDYPINQYVQLKVGTKYLVVGESAVRDSLALVDVNYANPSSIEEVNKSLWKFTVKEVKDENGLSEGYEVYLENKVNGAVALTKQDASATSAYYAPGAVVSAGSLKLSGFSYDADTKKVSNTVENSTSCIDFCGSAAYDAASKTVRKYVMGTVGDAIKLFVISEDASDIKTTDALEELIAEVDGLSSLPTGATALGDIVATQITNASISLTKDLLNGIGNDGFDLVFNQDITSTAKYENPFSANTLSSVDLHVYSSASYVTDAYKAAMKQYKGVDPVLGVEAGIDAQKAGAQAYVKEMKVALTETSTTDGNIEDYAPNALEIENANILFAASNFATGSDANKAITALKDVANDWEYENGKVADADEKAKALDDALAEVVKQLDAVKAQVSAAVSNFDKAVQEFVTGAYRYSKSEAIAYDEYKIKVGDDELAADAALSAAAALLGTPWSTYVSSLASSLPTVNPSVEMTASYKDYMPIAVVGQADTYVTVDTNYVATNEKYLALGTTKLNQLVIVKEDKKFSVEKVTYTEGQVVPASMLYLLSLRWLSTFVALPLTLLRFGVSLLWLRMRKVLLNTIRYIAMRMLLSGMMIWRLLSVH